MASLGNYDEALRFLFGRLNYERISTPPYRKGSFKLGRMRELLGRLGDPQRRFPVVHVAGTKGKGSTAAMIASVLRAAGYRTGLFCSPHLYRVEERLTVDGVAASEREVTTLLERIRPEVEAMDRSKGSHGVGPTYFEITTAMALAHFLTAQVDCAVLEVGLGGRLDSTNVCVPEVAVITSISRDHTKQLGTGLAQIAAEKAGIVKPRVPVVSGAVHPEAAGAIAEICRRRSAPLRRLDADFTFAVEATEPLSGFQSTGNSVGNGLPAVPLSRSAPAATQSARNTSAAPDHRQAELANERISTADGACAPEPARPRDRLALLPPEPATQRLHVRTWRDAWPDLCIPLLGRHQAANCAVAVAAVEALRERGWTIPHEAVSGGLSQVRAAARVEHVARRPDVIVDAAHNWASIRSLLTTLQEHFRPRRRLLVFATTQEKDLRGMLWQLLPAFDAVLVTRYQNNPRGVHPGDLGNLAGQLADAPVFVCDTPAEAWQTVCRLAIPDDLICIAGSFFIAAEMREIVLHEIAERQRDEVVASGLDGKARDKTLAVT